MIISLVAILMLLSDKSLEDDEIEWFFHNEGNKESDENFQSQFLGWKVGSASGTSTKHKIKSKTTESKEESQHEPTNISFPNQSVKTSPSWKTLILADSTIHYIPWEEMETIKPFVNSFIPDDAIDPFYLESDARPDNSLLNNELFDRKYVYKAPTSIPQIPQIVQQPKLTPKVNTKSFIMSCPIGLSFHRKIMPFLEPYRRVPQHPMNYGKSKIEPGLLPEMSRHTMFIHPRLLDMMKAMDRSILSFPSKFEYKSLTQLRNSPKRLQPNRYNDRIIV